jgi:hypothetical protein
MKILFYLIASLFLMSTFSCSDLNTHSAEDSKNQAATLGRSSNPMDGVGELHNTVASWVIENHLSLIVEHYENLDFLLTELNNRIEREYNTIIPHPSEILKSGDLYPSGGPDEDFILNSDATTSHKNAMIQLRHIMEEFVSPEMTEDDIELYHIEIINLEKSLANLNTSEVTYGALDIAYDNVPFWIGYQPLLNSSNKNSAENCALAGAMADAEALGDPALCGAGGPGANPGAVMCAAMISAIEIARCGLGLMAMPEE